MQVRLHKLKAAAAAEQARQEGHEGRQLPVGRQRAARSAME